MSMVVGKLKEAQQKKNFAYIPQNWFGKINLIGKKHICL